jgi:hypothetical protein
MSGQLGREQKVGTGISRAVQSHRACSFYLPLCLPAFLFHCLSWKSAVAVLGSLALSMYQMLPVLLPASFAACRSSPGLLQVCPSGHFIFSSPLAPNKVLPREALDINPSKSRHLTCIQGLPPATLPESKPPCSLLMLCLLLCLTGPFFPSLTRLVLSSRYHHLWKPPCRPLSQSPESFSRRGLVAGATTVHHHCRGALGSPPGLSIPQ